MFKSGDIANSWNFIALTFYWVLNQRRQYDFSKFRKILGIGPKKWDMIVISCQIIFLIILYLGLSGSGAINKEQLPISPNIPLVDQPLPVVPPVVIQDVKPRKDETGEVENENTQESVVTEIKTDPISSSDIPASTTAEVLPTQTLSEAVTQQSQEPVVISTETQTTDDATAEKEEKESETPPGEVEEKPTLADSGDFETFDKWRTQVLAQQHEKNKKEDIVHLSLGSQQKTSPPSALRTNYCSLNCGAKVLAANTEAQHASYALSENKDEYMLNPCVAQKWFVVEMCQPIRLQYLEIASFELFSSLPRKFKVYLSERWPTKEWVYIGTFYARDDRKIQGFPIPDQELYRKYLKVEMIDHYGQEHYCPLTLLRGYGTSYYDHEGEDPPGLEQTEHKAEEESSTNLLDSVINLVKGVLKGGNDNAVTPPTEKPDEVNKTGKDGCTANKTEDKEELPCLQDNVPDMSKIRPTMPEVPGAPITPVKYTGNTSTPSFPHINQYSSVVTMVTGTTSHSGTGAYIHCQVCDASQPRDLTYKPFVGHGSCIYIYIVLGSLKCHWPRCCKRCRSDNASGHVDPKQETGQDSTLPGPEIPHATIPGLQNMRTDAHLVGSLQPNIKDFRLLSNKAEGGAEVIRTMPISPGSTAIDITHIQPTPTQVLDDSTTKQLETASSKPAESPSSAQRNGQTTLISSSQTQIDTDIQSVTIATEHLAQGTITATAASKMGPDVAEGTPAEPSISVAKVLTTEVDSSSTQPPSSPPSASPEITPPVKKSPGVKAGNDNNNNNGVPVTSGEQNGNKINGGISRQDNDLSGSDNEQTIHAKEKPAPNMQVVSEASPNKPESAIVRLNNRIKTLELNLSLSSRYLEELSQRYKKQIEAMYKSFDQTVQKLQNTSRWAEMRDMKQSENIAALQSQIDKLQGTVGNMTQQVDRMYVQALESHLFFMIIEALVMIFITMMCARRSRRRTTQAELQELLRNMPDHPTSNRARRNSESQINSKKQDSCTLGDVDRKRTGSDSNLYIIEPTIPFLTEKKEPQENKKKKKKRRSNARQTQSVSSVSSVIKRDMPNDVNNMAAGLLFSRKKPGTPEQAESIRAGHLLSKSKSSDCLENVFEDASSSTVSSQELENSIEFRQKEAPQYMNGHSHPISNIGPINTFNNKYRKYRNDWNSYRKDNEPNHRFRNEREELWLDTNSLPGYQSGGSPKVKRRFDDNRSDGGPSQRHTDWPRQRGTNRKVFRQNRGNYGNMDRDSGGFNQWNPYR